MLPTFRGWIRSLAVLLLLGSASPATAGWSLVSDAPPSPPRRETLWGLPRDDPAIAIGAVLLALLIVLAVAWVAARVGDKS